MRDDYGRFCFGRQTVVRAIDFRLLLAAMFWPNNISLDSFRHPSQLYLLQWTAFRNTFAKLETTTEIKWSVSSNWLATEIVRKILMNKQTKEYGWTICSPDDKYVIKLHRSSQTTPSRAISHPIAFHQKLSLHPPKYLIFLPFLQIFPSISTNAINI